MKYIVFKVDNFLEVILTFPSMLVHQDIALQTGFLVRQGYKADKVEIVSAGFICFKEQHTYGESHSLGVKSRPEDYKLLKQVI